MTDTTFDSILTEKRTFAPPRDFAKQANLQPAEYKRLMELAEKNPEKYWKEMSQVIEWQTPFKKVMDWKRPFAKFYVGGKTNASLNCLDRHVAAGRGNKAAIVFEGEPGDVETITYRELLRRVCNFADGLLKMGLKPKDRVIIYMPMTPEAAVAMLACARIGCTHSVIFGGFSSNAIRDRADDAAARVVITADGGWRRGAIVPLKKNVDDALKKKGHTVEKVIVFQRCHNKIRMTKGRDVLWSDVTAGTRDFIPAKPMDSEHPLFVLYTSGSTGRPKGVVHTTGGYMVWTTLTSKWIFDLKEDDTFWCSADVGWVTGHSYVVYGILSNGATTLMYEGAPNHPHPGRFWEIIQRHAVTVFYTAPTAIRAFMKWGDEHVKKHDLSSLRLLGTVGEPINPEAWIWYHKTIGGERCPIVDTWWQTETGGILISPLPGITKTKPGSATLPLPGIDAAIVDEAGNPVPKGRGGLLVIRQPWASMIRTIFNDPARYKETYWSKFKEYYFAGDGAHQDKDGYFWIMGRVDDVLNVAGHRLGTMEVESALVSHKAVAEAAVVGKQHEIKGQGVVAFVLLKGTAQGSAKLAAELREHVAKEIGAIAKPDDIYFADGLPKTRSGKIMRRLLRDVAEGRQSTGDTTTLEDRAVLEKLRKGKH